MSDCNRQADERKGNGSGESAPAQAQLWPDATSTSHVPVVASNGSPTSIKTIDRKTIQDVLFTEGLTAVSASASVTTLAELQSVLVGQLGQNSMETRVRYAQSLVRWFFWDGLDGLARRCWLAYSDAGIEADILRYLYLAAEPVMGTCVTEALFPLENGMQIPPEYFDQYMHTFFGEPPSPKTRKRVKSNLMKLGFLERVRGKPDRLRPVAPSKTTTLLLFHHLFSPKEPRTVELRRLLADPFWKYLGHKTPDAVRAVLREANAVGLLGKYVVADQIEQVTTRMCVDEFLNRKVRL
jgi:hypothetical protein